MFATPYWSGARTSFKYQFRINKERKPKVGTIILTTYVSPFWALTIIILCIAGPPCKHWTYRRPTELVNLQTELPYFSSPPCNIWATGHHLHHPPPPLTMIIPPHSPSATSSPPPPCLLYMYANFIVPFRSHGPWGNLHGPCNNDSWIYVNQGEVVHELQTVFTSNDWHANSSIDMGLRSRDVDKKLYISLRLHDITLWWKKNEWL